MAPYARVSAGPNLTSLGVLTSRSAFETWSTSSLRTYHVARTLKFPLPSSAIPPHHISPTLCDSPVSECTPKPSYLFTVISENRVSALRVFAHLVPAFVSQYAISKPHFLVLSYLPLPNIAMHRFETLTLSFSRTSPPIPYLQFGTGRRILCQHVCLFLQHS